MGNGSAQRGREVRRRGHQRTDRELHQIVPSVHPRLERIGVLGFHELETHLCTWVREEGGGEPADRFVCRVMSGSAGGPRGEVIVAPSGNDVEVQVGDGLLGTRPAGVQDVDALGAQRRAHRVGHAPDEDHRVGEDVWRGVEDAGDVRGRHDQSVPGGDRVEWGKGTRGWPARYPQRGISVYQSAKGAVHGTTLSNGGLARPAVFGSMGLNGRSR